MKARTAVLFLLGAVTPAAGMTGNELLQHCVEADKPVVKGEVGAIFEGFGHTAQCASYVQGAVDAAGVYMDAGMIPKVICVPQGVTWRQVAQIIVKYLRENPALLHASAAQLAILAVTQAFPCAGVEPGPPPPAQPPR